jgi:signal transduction histidine kinase
MSGGAAADSTGDPQRRSSGSGGLGLISHCAHALRTPLNAILGFAQILALDRDQPLTPTQRQRVDQIQAAGWQLLQMIDDTVELARIGAGRLDISMVPVVLAPVLRDSLGRLGTQAGPDRVHVEMGPQSETIAWGDPDRLAQITANLVLGALQCNQRGGLLRAGVRSQDDGNATIWIQGVAPSFTADQLEKMFLPLDDEALDSTRGQNVQVSLALTQRLVELIGGQLQVQRGEDSAFELRLHLRGAQADGGMPRLADAA